MFDSDKNLIFPTFLSQPLRNLLSNLLLVKKTPDDNRRCIFRIEPGSTTINLVKKDEFFKDVIWEKVLEGRDETVVFTPSNILDSFNEEM